VQHETGRTIDEVRLATSLATVTRAIEAVIPAADADDPFSSSLLPPLSQQEVPAAAERVRNQTGETINHRKELDLNDKKHTTIQATTNSAGMDPSVLGRPRKTQSL
jgi:hypothetical protein